MIELNLLVLAEPEVDTGLALASRISIRSGFSSAITIVSSKPERLRELVNSRLERLPSASRDKFVVRTIKEDVNALLAELEEQASLRLVIVPGLGQLDEFRKGIIAKAHATVVCFEPHPGLDSEPNGIWLLGDDQGGYAQWLVDHLVAYQTLQPITLEELSAANNTEAPEAHQLEDLVVIASGTSGSANAIKRSKAAIEAARGPVLLVRGEASWLQWLLEHQIPTLARTYIPQMQRDTKRALSEQLQKFSKLDFEFVALICSATFLASFGLLQNSAAVIIGAMLVAPLMTPILGAGLSLAHGNRPLFQQSLKTISIGFVAAIATSCTFGLLVRVVAPSILDHDEVGRIVLTSEMWSRTHPTAIDFLVGLVGGAAAAFARTRSHLADALAGAAIAAALVPPIATAGLQLSLLFSTIAPEAGQEAVTNLIYGPVLLFVANMLTIMIGSSTVLWACGIRGDHSHGRRERWATRMSMLLMTLTVIVLVWIIGHP